jgi:hypothetical protein
MEVDDKFTGVTEEAFNHSSVNVIGDGMYYYILSLFGLHLSYIFKS